MGKLPTQSSRNQTETSTNPDHSAQDLSDKVLTRDEVQKVARLARLTLADDEIVLFTRQLGQVLEYVDILTEVDTKSVEPMAHAAELRDVFRSDEPRPSLAREDALANSPKTDGQFFLVPQILDGG